MTRSASLVPTILVCKNSMLREGLKHTLSTTRFRVCSEGDGDGQDETDKAPSLFVVDINLHQQATSDFIRDIKSRYPTCRTVVLAEEFDLQSMMSMLQSGADGYCLSTVSCEVLVKYLDLVMLGEKVFPSTSVLMDLSAGKLSRVERPVSAETPDNLQIISAGAPIRTLSSREAEILHCLMQGAPNKIIARKLEVAEATVKVHIKAILRKIRVTNRTQAAMWAVAHLPAAGASDESWTSR
ncbi:LuxR C-terminal-related transcriptional regulator [Microvirga lenta]|uniref:LuxR C-terminal-related transcriptional regulator n=1 Tax=Microvirga lenta TaxID=2881337 RepID=UPI001CFE0FEF|nr:response regulator transcription factor [Microvirga lenta]MCB5173881.1 response regulator transcription factor [Microvirga lenta]